MHRVKQRLPEQHTAGHSLQITINEGSEGSAGRESKRRECVRMGTLLSLQSGAKDKIKFYRFDIANTAILESGGNCLNDN